MLKSYHSLGKYEKKLSNFHCLANFLENFELNLPLREPFDFPTSKINLMLVLTNFWYVLKRNIQNCSQQQKTIDAFATSYYNCEKGFNIKVNLKTKSKNLWHRKVKLFCVLKLISDIKNWFIPDRMNSHEAHSLIELKKCMCILFLIKTTAKNYF